MYICLMVVTNEIVWWWSRGSIVVSFDLSLVPIPLYMHIAPPRTVCKVAPPLKSTKVIPPQCTRPPHTASKVAPPRASCPLPHKLCCALPTANASVM